MTTMTTDDSHAKDAYITVVVCQLFGLEPGLS